MSTIPCPNEGCQEVFANRMGKSRHLKSGKCRGKNPESNDLKTLFQKNDDGTYACIQCQNTIKHATNLKRHASKCETKTKEKHICGTCGKEFARRIKLKIHEGIHRRARFICNQCNKSFKRNYHFKKHVCEDEDEDEGYLPTFVANVFDGDNGRLEERNSELDEDESAVNVFDGDNGRLEERNSELDEDESAVNDFDYDNGRLEERNSELDEDESAVNDFDYDNGRLEERNSELDEDESAVNVFDDDNGRLEERNSELDEDESAVNDFDYDNGRLEERNSELDEDESAVNDFDYDNGRLEERNSELDEDESAVNDFDYDNGRLEERNSELDEDESAVNVFDDDNGRLEERNSELDEDESAVNVFDDDNGRLEERNSELDEDESAVNVFDDDNGRLEERNSELDEDQSAVLEMLDYHVELDEDESVVNVFDCESTPVKIKEKRIKDTIRQMRYRKHQKMNDELIDVSKIERRNILDKLLLADDDNEKYNQVYISSVAKYFRRMIKSKRYVGTNQQRVAVEILKSMFGSHLAEASFCKWLALKLEVEEMEFTSFLQISDKEVVVDRGGRSFLSKELRLDVYEYWIAK